MSNKKFINIIKLVFLAIIITGIYNGASIFAQGIQPGATVNDYGKNGVSYVLLNSEFSVPGIYRLNNYDASIAANPWRLYSLSNMSGKKASGLAANQKNQIFLLTTNSGGNFIDAPVGWLPTGIKFDEDSPIYLTVASPFDGQATDYHRDGYPDWHDWPTDGNPSSGDYWKRDQTYDGKAFEYAVNFGGPVGVRFLNGNSGTIGTPMWDGTLWPNSTSNAQAIPHPNMGTNRKVILPSHVGALSYYLYGTKNEPAIEGLPMDGNDGRDKYIFTDANGAGYFEGDSKHGAGSMFGCVVKRIYQKRTNSLDLYSGNDKTSATFYPTNGLMTQTQSNVLQTVDVKVRESYGKLCGDNCIDGGEIEGNKPIETALSTVTVVTSTVGNRYGFNPLGKPFGAFSTDASLRVVNSDGITRTIDISTDSNGQNFSSNITNKDYLIGKNITPSSIKTIGVSSNFSTGTTYNDYIYGSAADNFVVQDSWWGKGGVAYEYYKGNDTTPGKIVKLNYVNNNNPVTENLGNLTGKVDSIAIDGDGYLYALKTEENPTDAEMEKIEANINSLTIDSTSYTQTPNLPSLGSSFAITLSGWRRDQLTTTSNNEIINDSYINIPEGQQQPGDYKIAYLKQRVYKSVKRYPQGTGSLGTEEDRGTLFAGYDTWINKYKKTDTGVTWDYPIWRQEEGTKTSSILAELAVVNVADSPISMPGTAIHHIIASTKPFGQNSESYNNGTPIAEQGKLYFKIEGYKPVVGGQQRDFRNIGDIGNKYTDVKLNSIPAQDGTYAHDENNDNKKSGFPSTMFEAGNTYQTEVTWKIAQVENTTAVPLNSSSIKLVSSIITRNGAGDYKSLEYDFNQPGRYIIQANVTYNYFNNFGTAKRPTDLTSAKKSFTTEPILINVYANALNLNQSPSYITNIMLTPSNNYAMAPSESDFDVVEGSDAYKFGDLTLSFDAQFFREEHSNTSGNLQTYDGIGIWDYNYYKKLYENAKASSGMKGITVPVVSPTMRAYNYKGDGSLDVCYNPGVYNPGKLKASSVGFSDYTGGTRVHDKPTATDMQFIQWALYLRPITPQGDINPNTPPIFDRGDLIKSGTFAKADIREISPRKYSVSLTIKDIDNLINTPRDPKDYTLDLEIIYPRVTWLNNDLGANSGGNNLYFSSVIPYREGAAPIHVLSKLNITAFDNSINQSYESGDANLQIFKDEPQVTLCVRDKEKPNFEDKTQGLPFIETTGEPSISGNFVYSITDNNPFLSVSQVTKSSATKITAEEAKIATKLLTQELRTLTFSDDDSNKKFTEREDAQIATPVISQTSDTADFYSKDSWRIGIDYNVTMDSLSPTIFAPNGASGEASAEMKETGKLAMENWVGTLSYAIAGSFYDGWGVDSKYAIHRLYDPNAASLDASDDYANISEYEQSNSIEAPMKDYLERIDNDPPSIMVELISQSDNRRWVFQLIEGINDKVSCPPSVEDLAPSTLIATAYTLSGDNNIVAPGRLSVNNIPGTTNYKAPEGCVATVTVNACIPKAIPSFRRASRLITNVYIYDNCGYMPLSNATIKITTLDSGNSLERDMKLGASHDINGNLKDEFNNIPRGTFVYDMPMKVSDSQPQVKVAVSATDRNGNQRDIVIPVNIVESSFETRILETKENRR